MASDLEALARVAIEQAAGSGTLKDIEKAVGIAKGVQDARKAATEPLASDRSFRLSRLQALLTAGTTLVSVLGLIGTSVYNIVQLSAARTQAETTEWRDLVASLDETDDASLSVAVPFRIRSFASSSRYAGDAKVLAALVMGKMANATGFEQLYRFIFGEGREADLATLIQIAQQQNFSFRKLLTACKALEARYPRRGDIDSICWDGWSDETTAASFGVKPTDADVWTSRRRYAEISNQIVFISQRLGERLAAVTPRSRTAGVRVTDLHLIDADMAGLDFSGFDISGTFFDNISLEKSRLSPVKYSNASFAGTNWWDAERIDPPLLQYLLQNYYPHANESRFRGGRPTQDEYQSKVLSLCQRMEVPCPAEQLRYEELSPVYR